MDTAPVTAWTFHTEVPIPDDLTALHGQDERAVAAFKSFQDS